MKTAKEWFETFPEPYRSQAFKNCQFPNDYYESALNALDDNMIWKNTPEEHDYWDEFYRKLQSENK